MAYTAPSISKLKHFVTMCSMHDVVTQDGMMSLSREGIFSTWAEILPKRATQFGVSGYAIQEPKASRTHIIVTRYRADVDISSAAWFFENRRLSPPRWFKIIGGVEYSECGLFFISDVMLIERGDLVTRPSSPEKNPLIGSPLPQGVKL